jgi:hypothetical protein
LQWPGRLYQRQDHCGGQLFRMFRKLCWLVAMGASGAVAQEAPAAAPIEYKSAVQDKTFYVLSMMERTPGIRQAIGADPALKRMAGARVAALDEAA